MTRPATADDDHESSVAEFLGAVRTGVLLGAAVLVLAWPPARVQVPLAPVPALAGASPVGAPLAAVAPAAVPPPPAIAPLAVAPPQAAPVPAAEPVHRWADFGGARPSADVRHIAQWAFYTGDPAERSVVVIDKKEARVFVFAPDGVLRGDAPILLGSAMGDHTVPGVGDKPIDQVLPEERTTPAGRFIAQRGRNLRGEDVVWVDYDAAVSMHRVLATPHAVKVERRLERLASSTSKDNRISYGCINVPKDFFEAVLTPTVYEHGAVIYVLPETRTAPEVFGSYDVPTGHALAQR
mgnify:CR=1 FL=1